MEASEPRGTVIPAPSESSPTRLRAWGREMREVHRLLREALDLARTSIEDGPAHAADAVTPLDPLVYCWGFCTALSGHHAGEDRALFPELVARHPELAPVIGQLRQDHSMIEHLIGGLRRAMDTGASTEEQLRHLDGVDAVMTTHFRYEERRLLDLLDPVTDPTPTARELYGPLAPE